MGFLQVVGLGMNRDSGRGGGGGEGFGFRFRGLISGLYGCGKLECLDSYWGTQGTGAQATSPAGPSND